MNSRLPITLFTTCKPFTGETGTMQANALRSWQRLGLPVQVYGDEDGVAGMCETLNLQHYPVVKRSPEGTPLLDSLFALAKQHADTEYLAYINADIVLLDNFATSLHHLLIDTSLPRPCLITARRMSIPLCEALPDNAFSATEESSELFNCVREYGAWDQANAVDLFIFHRSMFNNIPAFSIGRMQWDNWLLWKARDEGAAIIDATASLTLLHPIHGYASHTSGWHQVNQGDEAQRNREISAGNTLNLEQAATHYLINQHLVSRQDCVALPTFHTDQHKLLAGGLCYLLHGVATRPLTETIDGVRNLLWNNDTYFPIVNPDSSFSTEQVQTILADAAAALKEGSIDECLQVMQSLLVSDLIHHARTLNKLHRPLYIWGCGQLGQRLQALLEQHHIHLHGFLDSDVSKQQATINGKPVASNAWLTSPEKPEHMPFIIIASMYYREIADHLTQCGLTPNVDFTA